MNEWHNAKTEIEAIVVQECKLKALIGEMKRRDIAEDTIIYTNILNHINHYLSKCGLSIVYVHLNIMKIR